MFVCFSVTWCGSFCLSPCNTFHTNATYCTTRAVIAITHTHAARVALSPRAQQSSAVASIVIYVHCHPGGQPMSIPLTEDKTQLRFNVGDRRMLQWP